MAPLPLIPPPPQANSPGFPSLRQLHAATDDRQHAGLSDAELTRVLKNAQDLTLLDVRGWGG